MSEYIYMSDRIPDKSVRQNAGILPENMSDYVSDRLSDKVAEYMSHSTPKYMSETLSDRMSKHMTYVNIHTLARQNAR